MSLYKPPNSSYWYIRIKRAGIPTVRRSTGTADRAEAQRIHDEVGAEVWAIADAVAAAQANQTGIFHGAVLTWCSVPRRSGSDISSMKKFMSAFSDRPLNQVDVPALDKALREVTQVPGTYNRYRSSINAVLNLAVEQGVLAKAPKLKRMDDSNRAPSRWLRQEEWARLYQELPEYLKAPAAFALLTGLRASNVFGLTWDRVDFARRMVWVYGIDMKARKSIGVPLNSAALDVLRQQQSKHPTLVFVRQGKRILKPKKSWHSACIRAGVGSRDADGDYVGFTWHGFRHTFATWHVQEDTPLPVLQQLGGWSDLRMVMNYAHMTT